MVVSDNLVQGYVIYELSMYRNMVVNFIRHENSVLQLKFSPRVDANNELSALAIYTIYVAMPYTKRKVTMYCKSKIRSKSS
jgi:hypothetical protein